MGNSLSCFDRVSEHPPYSWPRDHPDRERAIAERNERRRARRNNKLAQKAVGTTAPTPDQPTPDPAQPQPQEPPTSDLPVAQSPADKSPVQPEVSDDRQAQAVAEAQAEAAAEQKVETEIELAQQQPQPPSEPAELSPQAAAADAQPHHPEPVTEEKQLVEEAVEHVAEEQPSAKLETPLEQQVPEPDVEQPKAPEQIAEQSAQQPTSPVTVPAVAAPDSPQKKPAPEEVVTPVEADAAVPEPTDTKQSDEQEDNKAVALESATAELPTPEQSTTEPAIAEPATVDSATPEPATAEPATPEPPAAAPITLEPATPEPVTPEEGTTHEEVTAIETPEAGEPTKEVVEEHDMPSIDSRRAMFDRSEDELPKPVDLRRDVLDPVTSEYITLEEYRTRQSERAQGLVKERLEKFEEIDDEMSKEKAELAAIVAARSSAQKKADWRYKHQEGIKSPKIKSEAVKEGESKVEELDPSVMAGSVAGMSAKFTDDGATEQVGETGEHALPTVVKKMDFAEESEPGVAEVAEVTSEVAKTKEQVVDVVEEAAPQTALTDMMDASAVHENATSNKVIEDVTEISEEADDIEKDVDRIMDSSTSEVAKESMVEGSTTEKVEAVATTATAAMPGS